MEHHKKGATNWRNDFATINEGQSQNKDDPKAIPKLI
jgi:hypothetical protein